MDFLRHRASLCLTSAVWHSQPDIAQCMTCTSSRSHEVPQHSTDMLLSPEHNFRVATQCKDCGYFLVGDFSALLQRILIQLMKRMRLTKAGAEQGASRGSQNSYTCKTTRLYAISPSVDQSVYVHIQVTASKTSPDFRSGIVKYLLNTDSSYFNQFLPNNSVARGLTYNVAHILHSLLSQCSSPPLSPCSPIHQITGYFQVVGEQVGAEHSALLLV